MSILKITHRKITDFFFSSIKHLLLASRFLSSGAFVGRSHPFGPVVDITIDMAADLGDVSVNFGRYSKDHCCEE